MLANVTDERILADDLVEAEAGSTLGDLQVVRFVRLSHLLPPFGYTHSM